MPKSIKKNYWKFRPLLTDSLPYELPVIFSNDNLYFNQCRTANSTVAPLLKRVFERPKHGRHTIPYSYQIKKDSARFTHLSLVHPRHQLEWCEFYEQYENTILSYCNRSEYSLRHPSAVAAVYIAEAPSTLDSVLKTGTVHLTPDGSEPELAKLVSYFSYEKFNLLNKFHESKEFLRLEKKFYLLRQLDISKCFYGIYTHTIGWATKGKEFTKSNLKSQTFESRFDTLMQQANYNETNGIVVGPEISRIFAEIILQDIDQKVQRTLLNSSLTEGVDYSIRRYVDDFSIFTNDEKTLDKIEAVIRRTLEDYKLYLNDSKIRNFQRPFISGISLARSEIRTQLQSIRKILNTPEWKSGLELLDENSQKFSQLINVFRVAIKKNGIDFINISGGAIGELRSLIKLANFSLEASGSSAKKNWLIAIKGILDCALYITSVDLRVRTTYSLCQLLSAIFEVKDQTPPELFEIIEHLALAEIISISKSAAAISHTMDRHDSIELFNILICGSHFLGASFLHNRQIIKILDALSTLDASYFRYISLKHCLLRDPILFSAQLSLLNGIVKSELLNRADLFVNSETFHLFCDYLRKSCKTPRSVWYMSACNGILTGHEAKQP